MNVFIEKEFIENFEIEYDSYSNVSEWKILYTLFTEYTNLNWFLNCTEDSYEEVISNSEILTKLSDINPNIKLYSDLEQELKSVNSIQTLVFTEEEKEWNNKYNTILPFTFSNFVEELRYFLKKHNLEFDLSDHTSKFNWDLFHFLSEKNHIVFITDPYILIDESGQKIKDNLLPLLKENLDENKEYKVFILTEIQDKETARQKTRFLDSSLAKFKVKFFLINRLRNIETMTFHDRLLYTNYSITTSGIGFNIRTNKPTNSEILTSTIFEKKTYKKFVNHFKLIGKYIMKLEKYTDYADSFKTNNDNLYKEFSQLDI